VVIWLLVAAVCLTPAVGILCIVAHTASISGILTVQRKLYRADEPDGKTYAVLRKGQCLVQDLVAGRLPEIVGRKNAVL
jgi:hypothetical protein